FHRTKLERQVDARVESNGEPQILADRCRESRELGLQSVRAGRQVDKLVVARRVSYLHDLTDLQLRTGQRHSRAGQDAARFVFDDALDRARGDALRRGPTGAGD